MAPVIPKRIVDEVWPAELSSRAVGAAFRELIADGSPIVAVGDAKEDPDVLLTPAYFPKYTLDLFDTKFYLSGVRQNPDLRFFVAYVVQAPPRGGRPRIHPRIFYKDVSLIWRCASHVIKTPDELWIGKGDVEVEVQGDEECLSSKESTTDLPIEMQHAMEALSRRTKRVPRDTAALTLVLRRAPADRIEPYQDFSGPRRRAASNPRNLVNHGKSVAYFKRKNDPASLRFARGFEPDFTRGVIEWSDSTSAMYGGPLRRYRVLSTNREIQYMFFAARKHVWIIPPQATTTELSSYGVRTIDVEGDEDAFVPGFEYHFLDGGLDPPALHTQIPEGYAGEANDHDDSRADASAWIDRLPVVREFRRKVLGRVRL